MRQWPQPSGKLTASDRTEVTTITVDTLGSLIDRLDRIAWVDGLDWYFTANAIATSMADTYGLATRQVAGMIAALSPRCQWEDNVEDCEAILVDGEYATVRAFNANVGKALWIREGSDPESVLGGRKVRSFYRNIAFPYTSLDVTLDSWMGRALSLPNHYQLGEQGYIDRAGVYDAISDGFRTVAEEHGVLPHQLQATVWVAERNK